MGERTYRAGDVVRHLALGQEWLLACDEEHGRIAACGWPESWNRVEEVELVEEATDLVRLDRLRETAAMTGNDSRAEAARRQLAALAPAEGPRAEAIGADGRLCSHDRALLERDGEAVDMLRSLTAKAAELRAGLERLEADIVRLTAVVLEVPRG